MGGSDGRKFSTYDKYNDLYTPTNCAESVGGGWWFPSSDDCGESWFTGKMDEQHSGGIKFGSVHYKEVTMKIQPVFSQP